MFAFVSSIIFLFIFVSKSIGSTDSNNSLTNLTIFNECLINNEKYLFEYLSTTNNDNNNGRTRNVFTCSLDELNTMNDFDKTIWDFIPVLDGRPNQYYLRPRNKNKDLYLCATNKFEYVLQTRHKYHKTSQRLVQTYLIKNVHKLRKMNNKCVWNLNKVKGNTYIIRNQMKNETLFAGSKFLKFGKSKRNVYLWPNVQSNIQTQFRWIVVCSKDIFDFRKMNTFLTSKMEYNLESLED
jgi:hypothetical protein